VPFAGRVVAVSPHLDDVVLSLGAAVARATRAGAELEVLTPLAGDPTSTEPCGRWDWASGFRTVGEASAARRAEDAAACATLGATSRWLPFADLQTSPPPLDELADALAVHVRDAEVILTPGFPMTNPDHELVTRAVLRVAPPNARVALYLEQPYDWWSEARRLSRPGLPRRPRPLVPVASPAGPRLHWTTLASRLEDVFLKRRACLAYESQLTHFGHFPISRILLREHRRGGEHVAWLDMGTAARGAGASMRESGASRGLPQQPW
jgi:LmbE family N-acetylglucosaminyl deacetylase